MGAQTQTGLLIVKAECNVSELPKPFEIKALPGHYFAVIQNTLLIPMGKLLNKRSHTIVLKKIQLRAMRLYIVH